MKRLLVVCSIGALVSGCSLFRSEKPSFAYASWNIGHYALGKDWKTRVKPEEAEARAREYRKFLDEVNPDILGVCEYFDAFETSGKTPARSAVFGRFAHESVGPRHEWQWNALFWNGAPCVGTQWANYRNRCQKVYWLETRLKIGGEEVVVVQTHLDWGTMYKGHEDDRASQMRELIAQYRNERHVIISGDFNVGIRSLDKTKKTQDNPVEYKVFEDAGFTLGNDGRYKTCPAGDCFMSLDNIIVRGLKISDFKVWDRPDLSDHALVSARIDF